MDCGIEMSDLNRKYSMYKRSVEFFEPSGCMKRSWLIAPNMKQ
jgi:hypothetical protein